MVRICDDLTSSESLSRTGSELEVERERSGIPNVVRCCCESEVTVLPLGQTSTALPKQDELDEDVRNIVRCLEKSWRVVDGCTLALFDAGSNSTIF